MNEATKQRASKERARRIQTVVAGFGVLVVAGTLAFTLRPAGPAPPSRFALERAVPAAGGRLLLVQARTVRPSRNLVSSVSVAPTHERRLSLVDRDGRVLATTTERLRGSVAWDSHYLFLGLSDDTVWLGRRNDPERRLYALRLDTLTPRVGLAAVVRAQPMLRRSWDSSNSFVVGAIPRGLALLGADERVHVLHGDRTLEALPDVRCAAAPSCTWTENGEKVWPGRRRPEQTGPFDGRTLDLRALDLVDPQPVLAAAIRPEGVIVRSVDYDAPGDSAVLGHATGHPYGSGSWVADALTWTVVARDLPAPVDLGPEDRVLLGWLGLEGDHLLALLQATVIEDGGARNLLYLVEDRSGDGRRPCPAVGGR